MKKKDNIKKMRISKGITERAEKRLREGFTWGGSKEGHRYWSKIAKRLIEISKKVKK